MNKVFSSVVLTYEDTGSIKKTAKALRMSQYTVRKILVNEGAYSNESSEEVLRLSKEGYTADQISKRLKLSRSAVHGYMPYTKGSYLTSSKSKNALAIRRWRKRNENNTE